MIFLDDGEKSWFKLSDPILNFGNYSAWNKNLYYSLNIWFISENKLWIAHLGGK